MAPASSARLSFSSGDGCCSVMVSSASSTYLQGAHGRAEAVRGEFVLAVRGTVARRPAGTENPKLATGEVEVHAAELRILNEARPLPFPIDDEAEVDELGPIDQERFDAVMISAMQAAGVDPAMIYAYRSTGILISEQNLHQRSKVDRRRWQAAVEGYEEQSRPWT